MQKKKIQLGGVGATIRNDDFRRNTALQHCRPKNCRCKSPIGSKATMEFVWLNSQALLKSGLSNGGKKKIFSLKRLSEIQEKLSKQTLTFLSSSSPLALVWKEKRRSLLQELQT